MLCSTCGKSLPDNSTFCDGCGAAVAQPYGQGQYPQYNAAPAGLSAQDFTKKAKTAFSLSVVGVVLAFVPLTRLLGLIFAIIGMVMCKAVPAANNDVTVLATIEAAKQRMKDTKVLAIIGIIVGGIAALFTLLWFGGFIIFGAAIVEALEDLLWELEYMF